MRAADMVLVHDDEIVIEKVEFKELVRDSAWLDALQAAGVDNWEGIDEAARIFFEDHPEYSIPR